MTMNDPDYCEPCPAKGYCLRRAVFCEWARRGGENDLRHIQARSSLAETGSYPPPLVQAGNLGWALWDWACSGFRMASEEEQTRRLAICADCPRFDPGPRRCRHFGCGCFVDLKVKMRTERCPEGKW